MKFIQTIDAKLIYALIAGIVWLVIYLWRRFSIASWEAVTKRSPFLQQLPALILSGLLSAMPAIGKDLWTALQQIALGMLFGGGGAAAVHNLLKASPIPYTGAVPPLFPVNFPKNTSLPSTEEITADERPSGRLPK